MIIVYRAEVTDPTSQEPVLFEAATEPELEAQLAAWSGETEADQLAPDVLGTVSWTRTPFMIRARRQSDLA
jgi:hypothetical protein